MASRSLNKALLIGNLTRDPELRYTPNGNPVCSFSVATNSSWKDSDGNVQEVAEFHNIVAWNKLAEICSQLLKVGTKVFIEGEIRNRKWEKDGVNYNKTEIRADNMVVLSPLSKDVDIADMDEGVVNDTPKKSKKASKPSEDNVKDEDIVDSIDDLPF
jgi:single-strand DNA-binding protein